MLLLVPASHYIAVNSAFSLRAMVTLVPLVFRMGWDTEVNSSHPCLWLYSVLLLLRSHLSLFLECPEPWFICKAREKGIWEMDENMGNGCPLRTSPEVLQLCHGCYGT